jgi:regulator of protease activity HflC (stomatin/prohibitin superfamily)
MPYPIDEVRLPKVTRQNIIEIGMRAGVGTRAVTDVLRESLMLTGDENIIDVHCVVFWRIRNAQLSEYKLSRSRALHVQLIEGTFVALLVTGSDLIAPDNLLCSSFTPFTVDTPN